MAENSGGGGSTFLALIVGALLVVVIGIFALGWWPGNNDTQVTLEAPNISAPAAPAAPAAPSY